MSHDFDASAALLEQVNHALNSATPLRIQGSGSKAHLGRATNGEVLDTRQHRGIEDGTGADDRARHRLHRLDRSERGRGAQRDLEHRQTARDERLGHRDGVLDAVDDDHRDDGG